MVTNCLLFCSKRQGLNFPIRTVFFLFRQAGNMRIIPDLPIKCKHFLPLLQPAQILHDLSGDDQANH